MNLTYIFHSGFAIEDENLTIIVDFWQDPSGVLLRALRDKGAIYVLSSHFHPDHFNPEILSWAQERSGIHYILSKDIARHNRELFASDDPNITFLAKGQAYEDDNINVEAFGSTDIGVSWFIHAGGKRIFHAGDLNNWLWLGESTAKQSDKMQRMYLGELKDIYKKEQVMDVAMFPVDSRVGTDYMRGARQFIDKFQVGLFVPMHFSSMPVADAMAFEADATKAGIKFFKIGKPGDMITI